MQKILRDLWYSPPSTRSVGTNSRCYVQEVLSCLKSASCHPVLQVNRALSALQDSLHLKYWQKISTNIFWISPRKTLERSSNSHKDETLRVGCLNKGKSSTIWELSLATWQLWRTASFMYNNWKDHRSITATEKAFTLSHKQFFPAPVSCSDLTGTETVSPSAASLLCYTAVTLRIRWHDRHVQLRQYEVEFKK